MTKKKTTEKLEVFKFNFLISELVEHLLWRQNKSKVLALFKQEPQLKQEFIDIIYDDVHDYITDILSERIAIEQFGTKVQKLYE